MATKSTPDGVDLKLSNYSTTAAMNGSIASANNATLATVAANSARTLQLSKLMMEKAYYLHMRRLFPKMRLLFTDTDSVMVQIFELQDPVHAMAEANLNGAALFDVAGKPKDPERDLSALSAAARAKAIEAMGQLGKLGDETFPARILEYVGLRSKMYSILTVQPDGARKEKRKIKGVPKKAVTNVRHLEHWEVLEEGSERRAAFGGVLVRPRGGLFQKPCLHARSHLFEQLRRIEYKHYRESEKTRARDLFVRFRQSTPSSGSAAACR